MCTNFMYGQPMKNNLKKIRESRGLTQEQLAQKIVPPTSRSVIVNLEKGINKLHSGWLKRLSVALRCEPEELIADKIKRAVPIIGEVGAGAIIHSYDDHEKGAGLDEIEAPPGTPSDVIAVIVRGESMYPMMRDGWLLFYHREYDGVPPDCLGRVCVIELPDGRKYVKEIKLGSKNGFYHLLSHNAEPMLDQRVLWAAKVINILQR